jgi:hypothetical protein
MNGGSDLSETSDLKQGTEFDEDGNRRPFSNPESSILDASYASDADQEIIQGPTGIDIPQLESRHAKKRRVPSACIPCKLSRAKCSDTRPCSRCITASRPDDCIDGSLYPKVRPLLSSRKQCRMAPIVYRQSGS